MYKFHYPGIKLPEIMVCEKRDEAQEAARTGMPYVIRPKGWDDRKLLGAFIFRMLKDRFPDILWEKFLGISETTIENMVVYQQVDDTIYRHEDEQGVFQYDDIYGGDTTGEQYSEYRAFDGSIGEFGLDIHQVSLENFFKDSTEYIKIEKLMELGMLPKFMSDTIKAIEVNLTNNVWQDGWSKKLQAPVGDYTYSPSRDNLIILDISGSIPRGVSSTMLGIIDMLRTNCDADLIITGGSSYYWDKDDPLQPPETIRRMIGLGNESTMFADILIKDILGRQWGNVIVFGDQDCPWLIPGSGLYRKSYFDADGLDEYDYWSLAPKLQKMQSLLKTTEVGKLISYDLRNGVVDYRNHPMQRVPGYGLWAREFADEIEYIDASEWTTFMRQTL